MTVNQVLVTLLGSPGQCHTKSPLGMPVVFLEPPLLLQNSLSFESRHCGQFSGSWTRVCPPRGHLALSGDVFGCHTMEGGCC